MEKISPGFYNALGATIMPNGVNFCVFSKNCTAMELLFFDRMEDAHPSRVIPLDAQFNRTFYYWHVFVAEVGAGQIYAYRAYGRNAPESGLRFDGSKVLLDPYGRAVATGPHYDRAASTHFGLDNAAYAMKSVVVDTKQYDWEGDVPLVLPYSKTLIYELHIGGFTRHPSSRIATEKRGTYAALIEKIPYLKSLGVTTIELMPIYQFDEQDVPHGRSNYWGYSPVGFFAPHVQYSVNRDPLGAVNEFRDMVKALHRAEIEVILDVVFNHTAEGDHTGPTFGFRGLENRAYYMLESQKALYANYSGTGNTLNANNSIVRRMIMDSLRYWVGEMHVDGFRFDLASALARDEEGRPLANPPILWEIESEPLLAGTKIIAEAWDAAGLYQVGSFIGHRWAEWNGKFRDDVRSFIKGDANTVPTFTARLTASPDMYQADRDASRSVNFVTCHDGFTLNDAVSYNEKHNEANGEANADGSSSNLTWNCGVEGPTDDPAIEALRQRQIKNFLLALLVAQGTPMLLMGDEVRRTQHGNNNAYCQDNDLSWFNWGDLERHHEILHFTRGLILFTQSLECFNEEMFWLNSDTIHLTWHGTHLNQPDFSPDSHSIAFTLAYRGGHVHVIFNAYWEALTFELPPRGWRRIVDTGLPPPDDFRSPNTAPLLPASPYTLIGRSSALFLGE